jgi:protein-export membrane protein SecD
MFRTLTTRILVILAAIAIAGWYLHTNGITRGLDLQGGTHLLLAVSDQGDAMTAEERADARDRAIRVIRNRIDELGVQEPLVQAAGEERIIVELPGVHDLEQAREVLRRAAFLEFRLLRDDQRVREALPRTPGLGELVLETGAPGEYAVAEHDLERALEYVQTPDVQRHLPRDAALVLADRPVARGGMLFRPLYVLDARPFMTGASITGASGGRDPQFNQVVVNFELDRRGARTFANVTGDNIGRRMAILLDGAVVSAPVVPSRSGARGQIEMGTRP